MSVGDITALAGVTIVTPDLNRAVAAYRACLGYAGEVAVVTPELADRWRAPTAAGARTAVLRPASGEARFIRLVEGDPNPHYRPLASTGWIAAEIIVEDVARLADTLDRSCDFRTIGAPAVLDLDLPVPITAMQVVGPGSEVLYLTEIGGTIPGFDLPRARSFVGQVFIVVLAAPTIAVGAASYLTPARPLGPEFAARVPVLSTALGLPPGHRHALATIALGDASLIEVDAVPGGISPRRLSSIGLPSGIALVAFHGLRDERHVGAAGEWFETSPSFAL